MYVPDPAKLKSPKEYYGTYRHELKPISSSCLAVSAPWGVEHDQDAILALQKLVKGEVSEVDHIAGLFAPGHLLPP
jgi:hypothetical protein